MSDFNFQKLIIQRLSKLPFTLEEDASLLGVPYTIFIRCLRGQDEWGPVARERLAMLFDCNADDIG